MFHNEPLRPTGYATTSIKWLYQLKSASDSSFEMYLLKNTWIPAHSLLIGRLNRKTTEEQPQIKIFC